MISLSQLVRMPKGTTQTYLLAKDEESYFLKKLSTYALRTNAKVTHDVWMCVRLKDDFVQRMVTVMVLKPGRKIKRQGRKKANK